MTTEEKFADAESILGYPCCVLACRYNVNGRTTCGDRCEDHCFNQLYYDATNAKSKFIEHDEDGNKILVDNKYAFGDEAFIPLEPWVKEQDIKDFNYGILI
jgi:hypothetical protein